jgi:hypothetical protein
VQHLAVVVVDGEAVDPVPDQRLVAPVEAFPAEHAEVADHAHDARGVALHDHGAHGGRQDDDVALGAGGAVEGDPFVSVVDVAHVPAGDAVGVAARAPVDRVGDGSALDRQAGELAPRLGVGGGVDDGAEARDVALVDARPQGVRDLPEPDLVPRRRTVEHQARLRQLLGEPSELRRGRCVPGVHSREGYGGPRRNDPPGR